MRRVTTNMTNDNMMFHLRNRTNRMHDLSNKMADQNRLQRLRDDPVAAAHATRFESNIYRLRRYGGNINTLQSNQRIAEGYLDSANSILHRVRELTIQGANDTYSKEDKQYIAEELNQLLEELVEIANSKNGSGSNLFGGDRTQGAAYRVMRGNVPGAHGNVITNVDYLGSNNVNKAEISPGSFMETNLVGDQVFWAEQQMIYAARDAQGYLAEEEGQIKINGEYISIQAGDNIHAIMARINDSDAGVKASLDPVQNSLVIETTVPRQIWLEDIAESTILQDLGLVSEIGRPPYNIAADAGVSGGSLFDMVVNLRDRMLQGDTLSIGGSGLKGIDNAHNNLIRAMAELGSRDERMQIVKERLDYEIPETQQRLSREKDLDMTKAITDLRMLEHAHRAALQTAGRIMQPTLLDFLR